MTDPVMIDLARYQHELERREAREDAISDRKLEIERESRQPDSDWCGYLSAEDCGHVLSHVNACLVEGRLERARELLDDAISRAADARIASEIGEGEAAQVPDDDAYGDAYRGWRW